jgi:hypothetical protein
MLAYCPALAAAGIRTTKNASTCCSPAATSRRLSPNAANTKRATRSPRQCLGHLVEDIEINEDGSGETTYLRPQDPADIAVIACAPEVWFTEVRFREYPGWLSDGCGSDRRSVLRQTDPFGSREAGAKARRILADHGHRVMTLAGYLERIAMVQPPTRGLLIQHEIERIMARP